MANGYYGDNWDEIEEMVKPLDEELERFASDKKLSFIKSERSPGYRAFRWETDIGRLIEIFLESEEHRTWRLGITAYEDRKDGRYWKTETIYMPGSISTLHKNLDDLLEASWMTVSNWKTEDLYNASRAS
jgi:hypothetical protein